MDLDEVYNTSNGQQYSQLCFS